MERTYHLIKQAKRLLYYFIIEQAPFQPVNFRLNLS